MESNSGADDKLPVNLRSSAENFSEVITDAANCKQGAEREAESSLQKRQQYFEEQIETNDEVRVLLPVLSDIKNRYKNDGEDLEKPVNCGSCISEAEYECVCGLTVKQELRKSHNCVYDLRQMIEKQAYSLLGVQKSLKKVRKYVRCLEKQILEGEAEYRKGIDEKLRTLSESLDDLIMQETRRCHGRCKKHVRTEKCLCRGFTTAAPHVCCGKQGGICDC